MADDKKESRGFTDATGERWQVEINYAMRNKLRDLEFFDVLKLFEDKFSSLGELLEDVERFVRSLYLVLESQIKSRDLSPEQFAERLNGAAMEAASEAFARAVVDFFPEPRRGLGHAALDKGLKMIPRVLNAALEKLESLSDESVFAALTNSSGSQPVS